MMIIIREKREVGGCGGKDVNIKLINEVSKC
jgi:hypothetical protein